MNNTNSDLYYVQYNSKDVILYALSVGMGSIPHSYDRDLCYLFEGHIDFTVLPMFALALMFSARQEVKNNSEWFHEFPPEIMKSILRN